MKNTLVQPYLFFGGRCEEALEFYRTALGAEVDFLMRYKDSPEPQPPGMIPPGWESKVMHATFHIAEEYAYGVRWMRGRADLRRFLALARSPDASRGGPVLCRAGQRRKRNDAADQDILVTVLRHAHRSLWHRLDGQCCPISNSLASGSRSPNSCAHS